MDIRKGLVANFDTWIKQANLAEIRAILTLISFEMDQRGFPVVARQVTEATDRLTRHASRTQE